MKIPSYWLNDEDDKVVTRWLDTLGEKRMIEYGWTQITEEEFKRYERIFKRFANM